MKILVFAAAGLFAPSLWAAEDHTDSEGRVTIKQVLEQISPEKGLLENYQSLSSFGEKCKSTQAGLNCIKESFKGFYEDGLKGDLGLGKFLLKEGARAALSTNAVVPGGPLLLKVLGKKRTDEKIIEQVAKLGPVAEEALPVIKRLASDEAFRNQIFTQLNGFLSTFVAKAAEDAGRAVEDLDCLTIQGGICRVLGQVGYEALGTLLVTLATVEAGGAGGFAKLAALLPKLAKRFPALEPIVKGFFKFGDEVAALAKQSKSVAKSEAVADASSKVMKAASGPTSSSLSSATSKATRSFAKVDADTIGQLNQRHREATEFITKTYSSNPSLAADYSQAQKKMRAELRKQAPEAKGKFINVSRVTATTGNPPGFVAVSHQFKVLRGSPAKEYRVAVQEIYDASGRLAGHEILEIGPDRVLRAANLGTYGKLPINRNVDPGAKDALRKASESLSAVHGKGKGCTACHAINREIDIENKNNRSLADGPFINLNYFNSVYREVTLP